MSSALGQELRSVRLALGLSLKAAAGPSGISSTYLQKIEMGEVKNPSPNVLHGLANTLHMSYTALMKWAGYVVPDQGEISARPFDYALSAANLTAAERQAVYAFIAHLRDQRPPESQPK